MLSITQRGNASKLKRYHFEDLAFDDDSVESEAWYSRRVSSGLAPTWHGKGVEYLQLPPLVTQAAFDCLCDNLDPSTREQLTPRMRADRIIAYDFTFSLPKGPSLAYALAGDERLIPAAIRAVQTTMREVERHMRVRVRDGGPLDDRLTQNIVYALFVHRLSRPENGVSEPQVHLHAVTMNMTRDHEEHGWKAGKFFHLKKNAEYFETVFHRAMQREVRLLGYEIEPKGKFWDIANMPPDLTQKFSSRTKEIERQIERDGVSNPKVAAEYGARTREDKAESVRGQDLRDAWDRRLDSDEKEWLRTVKPKARSEQSFEREREEELRYRVKEAFDEEHPSDKSESRNNGHRSAGPDSQQARGTSKRGGVREGDDQAAGSSNESPAETVEFEKPARAGTRLRPSTSLRAVVRYTAQRIFERVGAVAEMDFIRHVLEAAPRSGISVDEVRGEMETLKIERRVVAEQLLLVDPTALGEEKRLVEKVIAGRGQFDELFKNGRVPKDIPEHLRGAYEHLAKSSDLVTVVEGFPGDSLRELLRELAYHLPLGPVIDLAGALSWSGEARARALTPNIRAGFVVVSPSAAAAHGLRETSPLRAHTVEKFLADPAIRDQATRGVVMVDQAHLLTTRDANRLIDAVKGIRGRLVLASQESLTRPNGPGNVPRVLMEAGAAHPGFASERADPKGPVAEPVRLAAKGDSVKALDALQQKGHVTEVIQDHVPAAVAAEYLRGSSSKKWKPTQAMVVTPSNRESERFTGEIRSAMKQRGLLGKGKERDQLEPCNFGDATKRRSDTYKAGMVVEFNQKASRKLLGVQVSRTYKPGDRWTVLKPTDAGVLIGRKGRTGVLPLAHADKFDVYEKRSREIAAGDVIRFTRSTHVRSRGEAFANKAWGAFKIPKRAVETGRPYTFERFTKAGHMQVSGGLIVPKDFGHWTHDYCRTPNQSQGVRKDRVIFAHTQDSPSPNAGRSLLGAMTSAKKGFAMVTDNLDAAKKNLASDRRRVTPMEADMGIVPPAHGLDKDGPRRGHRGDRDRDRREEESRRRGARDKDHDRDER